MFRRTSYASVAAGNAPARSGAFSHLINANQASGVGQPQAHNSTGHSRQASRGEADGYNSNSMAGSWGRGGHLPSYASQFGNGNNGFMGEMAAPAFFIPSYLRGSKHAEKLEEAHNTKLKARQDSRSAHSSHPGSLSTSSSSVNLHKMVPSHRGMTHDIIERVPIYHEETAGILPTGWNDGDKAPGLDVIEGGVGVRFGGLSKSHDEAASIRADHPMPRQCGIYYFEVTVVSKGKEGLVGIGFSGTKVPLHRIPGWEQESWAYHGDDGYSFCCTSSGKQYGPKFSNQDVIGCGVNFRTGSAFFTKNGTYLGIAFRDIKGDRLFPSVGLKKPGEQLRANFGQLPFCFDIDTMVQNEKLFIQEEILKTSVTSLRPPLDERALIHKLIAQYLSLDGYVETARAFAEEVHEEAKALANGNGARVGELELPDDTDATNRQKIRQAILDGDIDKALKHTKAYHPLVLHRNENIYFKLRCRKFIEMIRKCNELKFPAEKREANGHPQHDDYGVFDHDMELDDQVQSGSNGWGDGMDMDSTDINTLTQEIFDYGQELQAEFSGDPRREVNKALKDTFALLAYGDVNKSSLAHMLDISGRLPIAEELNAAILVASGRSSVPPLEKLCKQAEALVDLLGEDGGAGAYINVRKDFLQ